MAPARSFAVLLVLTLGLAGAAPAQSLPASHADPRIAKLLAEVAGERLAATLRALQGFGTRNTLSSPDSPTQGIGAARQWIFEQLKKASPRLRVSFDTYQVPKQGERITRDVELRNVAAVLPGRTPRRVYVSAHYDSFARRAQASATGARPAAQPPPPTSPPLTIPPRA